MASLQASAAMLPGAPLVTANGPAQRLKRKTAPPPQLPLAIPLTGDEERTDARKYTYLVSAAHPQTTHSQDGILLVSPDTLSREALRDAMLDACSNPIHRDLGNIARRLQVDAGKMVVVKEKHSTPCNLIVHDHAHWALSANDHFMYNPVKRALLVRHGLATHWDSW